MLVGALQPALTAFGFTELFVGVIAITAIALSVIATSMVVVDGESNWVEGLLLLAVYLILALAFYYVP